MICNIEIWSPRRRTLFFYRHLNLLTVAYKNCYDDLGQFLPTLLDFRRKKRLFHVILVRFLL